MQGILFQGTITVTVMTFLFQRFGTKHIVATNMILWLGTVIKESVEEIVEQGKEAESVSLILVMPILVALLK